MGQITRKYFPHNKALSPAATGSNSADLLGQGPTELPLHAQSKTPLKPLLHPDSCFSLRGMLVALFEPLEDLCSLLQLYHVSSLVLQFFEILFVHDMPESEALP